METLLRVTKSISKSAQNKILKSIYREREEKSCSNSGPINSQFIGRSKKSDVRGQISAKVLSSQSQFFSLFPRQSAAGANSFFLLARASAPSCIRVFRSSLCWPPGGRDGLRPRPAPPLLPRPPPLPSFLHPTADGPPPVLSYKLILGFYFGHF